MNELTLNMEKIYINTCSKDYYGICIWNMNTNEVIISENITGYQDSIINSMEDYIDIIVYEKDKKMALQDLYDFLNEKTPYYKSKFRIKTKKGKIKWVSFNGNIKEDKQSGMKIFSATIFSDSTENLSEVYDNLTNLPNRDFVMNKLNNSIKKCEIENRKGALIYIDIDEFKFVNDYFGTYIGDLTLKSFANVIDNLIGKNCELARLSGDEFVIVIHKLNEKIEINKICNNIYDYFKNPLIIDGNEIFINVSIGVTVFPDDSNDADTLLRFCDLAMLKSKKTGKNTCTFYSNNLLKAYNRESLIKTELKNSILNNELSISYQPQFDIFKKGIIGIEALIRWKNEKLGNVSPAEFIPIAEKNGFIVDVGNWVMENAIYTASEWKEKGYSFNKISINVSPIQLYHKEFNDKLICLCKKYSIPCDMIEIELTEGNLIDIWNNKIEVLNELIKYGINIAIDDFGTGYSSLSYLSNLPVKTLKIDKSFTDNLQNKNNKAIISSIVYLSKYLDFTIITEGVETFEQINILKDLGCHIYQGYYFSKPLAKNKIEDLLINTI